MSTDQGAGTNEAQVGANTQPDGSATINSDAASEKVPDAATTAADAAGMKGSEAAPAAASDAAGAGTGQAEERVCRFCFGTDADSPGSSWVRPCKCRGSMGNVHQMCLNQWLYSSNNAVLACQVCSYKYKWKSGDMRALNECYSMICTDLSDCDVLSWIPELWLINTLLIAHQFLKHGEPGLERIWGENWRNGMTIWAAEAVLVFIPVLNDHLRYFRNLWTRMHTFSFAECDENSVALAYMHVCLALAVTLLTVHTVHVDAESKRKLYGKFPIPDDYWYTLFECKNACRGMCMSDNEVAEAPGESDGEEHSDGNDTQFMNQFKKDDIYLFNEHDAALLQGWNTGRGISVQTPVAYYCFPLPWYLVIMIIVASLFGLLALSILLFYLWDQYWPYEEIRMPAYVQNYAK